MAAQLDRDVLELKELIERWREPDMIPIRSDKIIPDWTNRERTGLSLEHIHNIATNMAKDGFKKREQGTGHDIPVLVREFPPSELGQRALQRWRVTCQDNAYFPPCLLEEDAPEFFCSLGNGHFSQALNLFRNQTPSIFFYDQYSTGDDAALKEAIDIGVESIILRNDMAWQDRKFVSLMLNKTHDLQWNILPDGSVDITTNKEGPKATQFEMLSKVLDAEELSALVRIKLGVDVHKAQKGYLVDKSRSKL
mmetsp:Transcript_107/g.107  ORF Transcript_107/g.107 Transcript_107/m.107 type:complete len:251 (+) Transcript_107:60-812(+)|eukprot:CAMPEP_0197864248 /NCGR_PEP_ID=MMETSP1438-20131217/42351_1 /TAXON_ID=1461541 /ORGANISM="Pterosperma sp., Strain CCMP1384" /LENGTH=250 /DNA_ID=CAMNT_0043482421 /DNA_START=53 /DNA_END=805 /DNA_ORIENTATION=-